MDILIDFDGTCVRKGWPHHNIEPTGAVEVLKKLVANGHKLILFTMRSDGPESLNRFGEYYGLTEALIWFKEHKIPLYGVQKNPTQSVWSRSPKAYGQMIIDDTSLGVPLIKPEKQSPFVDWKTVEEMLTQMGLI